MPYKDKKRKNTEYFIYVPDTKEKLVVTEEVYLAYYRPIWKIQNKAQHHGQCRCTKRQLWKCDGDCANCKYHTEGDVVYMDNPIDKSNPAGDTFADHIEDKNFNLDEIVGDMYLLNELMNALSELDTKTYKVCTAIMENGSMRKAAESLGMPWSSFKKAWQRIKPLLYERLKDFL